MGKKLDDGVGGRDNKKIKLLNTELLERLKKQHSYILRSAAIFDAGNEDEAPRLATTLRVLLHDTAKSTSLLSLMAVKHKLQYVNTAVYRDLYNKISEQFIPPELAAKGYRVAGTSPSHVGFVQQRVFPDGTAGWFAPLGHSRHVGNDPYAKAIPPSQEFDEWWEKPVVETFDFRPLSRKNLVTIMANQDGGAHVDERLDADYHALCNSDLGAGFKQWVGTAPPPEFDSPAYVPPPVRNNVAYASVRQIAYEIEQTLVRSGLLD